MEAVKSFLSKLFSENSAVSSTRFMSVACVLGAIGMGFWCIYQRTDLEKAAWLVSAFLVPAFGGKVMQKRYEVQQSKSEQ